MVHMIYSGRRVHYSLRLGESLFLYTGLCLGVTVACYAQYRLGTSLQDVDICRDNSTKTDIDCSGYRVLMDVINVGTTDGIILHQISRIEQSVSDLKSDYQLSFIF
jgi:hypothetical protein